MSTTTQSRTMEGLTLTPRGELVRDAAIAIIGLPLVYGGILATITIMEGMGL